MPPQCHAVLCCPFFYGCASAYGHRLLCWLIVHFVWLAALGEGAPRVIAVLPNSRASAQANAQPGLLAQSYLPACVALNVQKEKLENYLEVF